MQRIHQISPQQATFSTIHSLSTHVRVQMSVFPRCSLPLTSDWSEPPLSCWMKDSFIQNNTWVGPLVYGLQTRGGRRIWFNGRLSYQAVEEKRSVCLSVSVSFPASVNIRSLAVSLGSKRIDLNLYRKRIKASWEVTFGALKGLRWSFTAGILLADKYVIWHLRGV